MLETDEYLKLAASNFKISEKHLAEAEQTLHVLQEKLDNCLKLMKGFSPRGVLMWEQLDAIVRDNPAVNVAGLNPVTR